MKKRFKNFAVVAVCLVAFSSCTINEHIIGNGASGTEMVRKKSVYVLGNRVVEVDSKALAGGAADYTLDTRTNFIDMLIQGVSFGLVTTRTVSVTK